ncbi:hypothetical protein [Streptomyces californicus]|uniref:hypothetical protein n=1 Tax=Streptomyces californicus TaxID=67351 RepID=UPI0033F9541D
MSGPTEGRAEDNGRVYQSQGDQHITEHHHHGSPAEPSGTTPDSVGGRRWGARRSSCATGWS